MRSTSDQFLHHHKPPLYGLHLASWGKWPMSCSALVVFSSPRIGDKNKFEEGEKVCLSWPYQIAILWLLFSGMCVWDANPWLNVYCHQNNEEGNGMFWSSKTHDSRKKSKTWQIWRHLQTHLRVVPVTRANRWLQFFREQSKAFVFKFIVTYRLYRLAECEWRIVE